MYDLHRGLDCRLYSRRDQVSIIEKQIFGKADTAGAYKPKRLKTSLISLGTSSILGYALSEILLDLVPTGNSTLVIAGSFIALIFYYFVHAFVYAYLLRGE